MANDMFYILQHRVSSNETEEATGRTTMKPLRLLRRGLGRKISRDGPGTEL
jgi:hypothetical protein